MRDARFDQETETAFAQLEHELPRVAPRADLFERIAAALPEEPTAAAPAPLPERRVRWRLRRPTLAIPAGAALVALVAALVVAVIVSGGPSASVSAALVAHGKSGAYGRVELYSPTTRSGRLVVELKGLGAAPTGEHYTVWVLRSGISEMTPVASLSSGADVRLDVPLPSPGHYSAVDISLQRDDAPPLHSSHSVAGASLS
ncbi:MAG: anti-sigma factor [Gaiellales bacterium]